MKMHCCRHYDDAALRGFDEFAEVPGQPLATTYEPHNLFDRKLARELDGVSSGRRTRGERHRVIKWAWRGRAHRLIHGFVVVLQVL